MKPFRRPALLVALVLAISAAPAGAVVPAPVTAGGGDRMVAAWADRDEDGATVRLVTASPETGIGEPETVARVASPGITVKGVGRSERGDVLVVWERFPVEPPAEGGLARPFVEAALRPAGGAFGPVIALSAGPADAPAPVHAQMSPSGHAVVAWLQDGRTRVAAREPGGGFAEVAVQDVGAPLGIGTASDGETLLGGALTCRGECRLALALRPAGGREFGPSALLPHEELMPGRETVAMGPSGDAVATSGRFYPAATLVTRRRPGGGFGEYEQLDAAWLGSSGAGASAAGETVVAWSRSPGAGGGVFASAARRGEPFGAPQQLDSARSIDLTRLHVDADGSAVAAWSVYHEGIRLARRPAGAGFAAPIDVLASQDTPSGLSLAAGGGTALLTWGEEDARGRRMVAAWVPRDGAPVLRTLQEALSEAARAPVATIPRHVETLARRRGRVRVPVSCEKTCRGDVTVRARGRVHRTAFALDDDVGEYVRVPVARGARRVAVQVRTGGRVTDRRTLATGRAAAPRCPRNPFVRMLDWRAGTAVFADPDPPVLEELRTLVCRTDGSRPATVFTEVDDPFDTDRVTRARAGARSVALVVSSGGRDTGSGLRLELHDVRTGAEIGREYVGGSEAFDAYPPVVAVHDLLVSDGGTAVAVIQNGRAVSVLALPRAGGRQVLDPEGADKGSLRIRGKTVVWRHGGQLRSAPLPGG